MNSATMTTSPSSLRAAIERRGAIEMQRRAQLAGELGVTLIAQEAASTYPRKRPESRRRGSSPIDSQANYDFDVLPTAKGARLEFFIVGNHAFKVKFFSLNNGSRGHAIFPKAGLRPGAKLAYNRDDPANPTPNWFPRIVQHPGTTGTHFYEKAIKRALRRLHSR